jgi:hypothetical protein
MPKITHKSVVICAFAQIIFGCSSTPSVSFRSDLDASLTAVSFNNPQSTGQKLGTTPITVPLSSLRKGPIRIQSPGLPEQYWIFTDVRENSLEIELKLAGQRPQNAGTCSADTMNQQGRLLLMAYEALTRSDFRTTLQIADQLSGIAPSVAAPHILSGIAFMQTSQNDKALSSFTRAKALDPSDKNIDRLLQALKK